MMDLSKLFLLNDTLIYIFNLYVMDALPSLLEGREALSYKLHYVVLRRKVSLMAHWFCHLTIARKRSTKYSKSNLSIFNVVLKTEC